MNCKQLGAMALVCSLALPLVDASAAPRTLISGGLSGENYSQSVFRRIGEVWTPPQGLLGDYQTDIELAIDSSGMLTDCRVVRSSGADMLDVSTCGAAHKVGRFGPPPGGQPVLITCSFVLQKQKEEPQDPDEVLKQQVREQTRRELEARTREAGYAEEDARARAEAVARTQGKTFSGYDFVPGQQIPGANELLRRSPTQPVSPGEQARQAQTPVQPQPAAGQPAAPAASVVQEKVVPGPIISRYPPRPAEPEDLVVDVRQAEEPAPAPQAEVRAPLQLAEDPADGRTVLAGQQDGAAQPPQPAASLDADRSAGAGETAPAPATPASRAQTYVIPQPPQPPAHVRGKVIDPGAPPVYGYVPPRGASAATAPTRPERPQEPVAPAPVTAAVSQRPAAEPAVPQDRPARVQEVRPVQTTPVQPTPVEEAPVSAPEPESAPAGQTAPVQPTTGTKPGPDVYAPPLPPAHVQGKVIDPDAPPVYGYVPPRGASAAPQSGAQGRPAATALARPERPQDPVAPAPETAAVSQRPAAEPAAPQDRPARVQEVRPVQTTPLQPTPVQEPEAAPAGQAAQPTIGTKPDPDIYAPPLPPAHVQGKVIDPDAPPVYGYVPPRAPSATPQAAAQGRPAATAPARPARAQEPVVPAPAQPVSQERPAPQDRPARVQEVRPAQTTPVQPTPVQEPEAAPAGQAAQPTTGTKPDPDIYAPPLPPAHVQGKVIDPDAPPVYGYVPPRAPSATPQAGAQGRPAATAPARPERAQEPVAPAPVQPVPVQTTPVQTPEPAAPAPAGQGRYVPPAPPAHVRGKVIDPAAEPVYGYTPSRILPREEAPAPVAPKAQQPRTAQPAEPRTQSAAGKDRYAPPAPPAHVRGKVIDPAAEPVYGYTPSRILPRDEKPGVTKPAPAAPAVRPQATQPEAGQGSYVPPAPPAHVKGRRIDPDARPTPLPVRPAPKPTDQPAAE